MHKWKKKGCCFVAAARNYEVLSLQPEFQVTRPSLPMSVLAEIALIEHWRGSALTTTALCRNVPFALSPKE
jgi:hypothetical protein